MNESSVVTFVCSLSFREGLGWLVVLVVGDGFFFHRGRCFGVIFVAARDHLGHVSLVRPSLLTCCSPCQVCNLP